MRSTKQLTSATAKAAAAAQTLQQSDIIAAANLARQSVCELLTTTRNASHSAESADARYMVSRRFCLKLYKFLSLMPLH